MTDPERDREAKALALQSEIRHKRAQVVADIDELRDAIRLRLSVGHLLRTHPRITRGLSIALGVAGIATLALIWRASKRSSRAAH